MRAVRCPSCGRVYIPEELTGNHCPGCQGRIRTSDKAENEQAVPRLLLPTLTRLLFPIAIIFPLFLAVGIFLLSRSNTPSVPVSKQADPMQMVGAGSTKQASTAPEETATRVRSNSLIILVQENEARTNNPVPDAVPRTNARPEADSLRTEPVKASIQASPGEELVVRLVNGAMEILTHDSKAVEAEVLAEDEAEANRVSQAMKLTREGNRVRFRPAENSSEQICYRVFVPRKYDLDLKGLEGQITVTNIEGNVKVSTTEGYINVADVRGGVQAESRGGAVAVRSATGPVKIKTAGGHIAVGEVRGDTYLETAGGSIKVLLAREYLRAKTIGGGMSIVAAYQNVKADSVGGSISACFLGQPKDNSFLTTKDGSLEAFVAPTLKLDLKAVTGMGKIDSAFPMESHADQKEKTSIGQINGGGKRLALRTLVGNIEIKPPSNRSPPSLEKDFAFFEKPKPVPPEVLGQGNKR